LARPHQHIYPAALERSLRGLRHRVDGAAVEDALDEVLRAACVLFGVTGTGLMVIDENRALCSVAATDEPGRTLEEMQERAGQGPCVDAVVFDSVVHSPDLATDDRWPEIKPQLLRHGVRALLGVPVHLAGETVGTLNGYVDEPYDWEKTEVRGLQAYSDLIGSLLGNAVQSHQRSELADQLQYALNNRVVIERAVGMIMGVQGVDAITAFNRLRAAARARRERVVDLAGRVLEGEPLA
jgi:GAF domain-containing protein